MSSAIGTLGMGLQTAGPQILGGLAQGRAQGARFRHQDQMQQERLAAQRQQNMLTMQRLLIDLEEARRRPEREDRELRAKRLSELSKIILEDTETFAAMPEATQEKVLLEFAGIKGYSPYGEYVPAGKRREQVPRTGIDAAMMPTKTHRNQIVDDPSAPARVHDIGKIPVPESVAAQAEYRRQMAGNIPWKQQFMDRQLNELREYHRGILENQGRGHDIREIENNWRKDIAYQQQQSNDLRTAAYRELTHAQAAKVRDGLIDTLGRMPAYMRDRIKTLQEIGFKQETLSTGRVRFSRDPISVWAREQLAEILGMNAAAMDAAAQGGGPASPYGPGLQVPAGQGAFPGAPPVLPPAGALPPAPPGGTSVVPLGAAGLLPPAPTLPTPALPPLSPTPIPGGGSSLGAGWQPGQPVPAPRGTVPAPRGTAPKRPPGPVAPQGLQQRDIDYVQRLIDDGLYEGVAAANDPKTEGGKRLRDIYRIITGKTSPR